MVIDRSDAIMISDVDWFRYSGGRFFRADFEPGPHRVGDMIYMRVFLLDDSEPGVHKPGPRVVYLWGDVPEELRELAMEEETE